MLATEHQAALPTVASNEDTVLVLSSCPDAPTAERIARALVESGLAACVQELPISASTYRWNNSVERTAEVQLVIKTLRSAVPALTACLTQLHPYELPELLVVDVAAGSAAYLDWVRASVSEHPSR